MPHTDRNSLDYVIGVDEAAELWNLTPGTVKNYCKEGRVIAKKIGKTWIIDRNQPNPRRKFEVELLTFAAQYNQVISSATNQMEKDRLYADLMTRMEQSFSIPIFKDNSTLPEVAALYKRISMSRESL